MICGVVKECVPGLARDLWVISPLKNSYGLSSDLVVALNSLTAIMARIFAQRSVSPNQRATAWKGSLL